jgi:hypothetical protein
LHIEKSGHFTVDVEERFLKINLSLMIAPGNFPSPPKLLPPIVLAALPAGRNWQLMFHFRLLGRKNLNVHCLMKVFRNTFSLCGVHECEAGANANLKDFLYNRCHSQLLHH